MTINPYKHLNLITNKTKTYPPNPELSALTTPTQNMAATAASMALPPRSIMFNPISEHSSTSVATAALAPIYI